MGTLLDPWGTDFGNDIADLTEAIAKLLENRGTQYVDCDGDTVEGYVIDYLKELDEWDFPRDEDDLSQIADSISDDLGTTLSQIDEAYSQMKNPGDDDYSDDDSENETSDPDPRVWFEGDYLYIVF